MKSLKRLEDFRVIRQFVLCQYWIYGLGVFLLKCPGIAIQAFHGNCFVRSTNLLTLPNIDPDTAFGVQLSVDENIDSNYVSFQAALLYTSSKGQFQTVLTIRHLGNNLGSLMIECSNHYFLSVLKWYCLVLSLISVILAGERKIRVHTLCIPVAKTLADVHANANQLAIVDLLAKMGQSVFVVALIKNQLELINLNRCWQLVFLNDVRNCYHRYCHYQTCLNVRNWFVDS